MLERRIEQRREQLGRIRTKVILTVGALLVGNAAFAIYSYLEDQKPKTSELKLKKGYDSKMSDKGGFFGLAENTFKVKKIGKDINSDFHTINKMLDEHSKKR